MECARVGGFMLQFALALSVAFLPYLKVLLRTNVTNISDLNISTLQGEAWSFTSVMKRLDLPLVSYLCFRVDGPESLSHLAQCPWLSRVAILDLTGETVTEQQLVPVLTVCLSLGTLEFPYPAATLCRSVEAASMVLSERKGDRVEACPMLTILCFSECYASILRSFIESWSIAGVHTYTLIISIPRAAIKRSKVSKNRSRRTDKESRRSKTGLVETGLRGSGTRYKGKGRGLWLQLVRCALLYAQCPNFRIESKKTECGDERSPQENERKYKDIWRSRIRRRTESSVMYEYKPKAVQNQKENKKLEWTGAGGVRVWLFVGDDRI
ncbi:hypothetical protein C8R43DRAFT_965663 [Mycena crocata]|nr:hypothetical protein C8R43DRAFT_965663 [Mycena crocata]